MALPAASGASTPGTVSQYVALQTQTKLLSPKFRGMQSAALVPINQIILFKFVLLKKMYNYFEH